MSDPERSTRRAEREHLHERAADPADTADRPLEPRSGDEQLHETDTPHAQDDDPHHRLNTPVGEVDPISDSDPYRAARPEDDADSASGIRGEGERPSR
jgi:hypothetical protein